MKLLHTLFPLVLLPALFTAEINMAQAFSSVSIDRAVWRDSKDLLVFKGTGNPGSNVEIYLHDTTISLGRRTVNRRGIWKYKTSNLAFVPCAIRAESGPTWAESNVARAPADCVSRHNPYTGDDDGDVTVENNPPAISGSPSTQVAEGQSYNFRPNANDADNDNLTFSIVNSPSWASFNRSTGLLSGTPGSNDAGTISNIRISVSDGNATASLNAFSITVTDTADPNQAPTISGTPPTSVAEGGDYRFTPSASDAEGNDLLFSITNRPTWASFNSSTGLLSGTPSLNDAGTTDNIRISVSDGDASASLNAFSITVNNTNQAPTITGAPEQSVIAGDAYIFSPNASDPDDNSLNFTVTNLPNWASFNSTSGILSGTPSEEDAGLYEGIVISVTDNNETSSLAPLNLLVEASEPTDTTGSVSLAWVPPSTRTDGSSLDMSEIAGYKVYMGDTQDTLEQVMDFADSTTHNCVLDDIENGDYYFAVTTYDNDGNESGFSNIAMKSTQ
ncbi:MAG: putative Ig domain-containing protein [Candidatus Thiodiazotropha sp. (ex Ustalcina ferruginea)]|nr:putative Ig domain-containing protein [Candidatus Thiodiazotropha sp. (ex Ustalcina ferruginea)]